MERRSLQRLYWLVGIFMLALCAFWRGCSTSRFFNIISYPVWPNANIRKVLSYTASAARYTTDGYARLLSALSRVDLHYPR